MDSKDLFQQNRQQQQHIRVYLQLKFSSHIHRENRERERERDTNTERTNTQTFWSSIILDPCAPSSLLLLSSSIYPMAAMVMSSTYTVLPII